MGRHTAVIAAAAIGAWLFVGLAHAESNADWWRTLPSGCWRRIISRTSAPYLISGKIHLKTMEGLFEQVLKIALEARALKVPAHES